ncbi:MAG TPA: VanZ family protein [Micromonosporaceae bacterium]|jgi:hypothetical protein
MSTPSADAPFVTSWLPVIVAALAGIPVAYAAAVWLTQRRRRRGIDASWAARSAWADVVMVVGTLPWLVLTLMPARGQANGVNLVPFRDLSDQVHQGIGYASVQIVGNLCVFAALGFGMPIRWRISPWQVLVVAAWCSAAIETVQWVAQLGRFASVDDVLVNAIGGALGALLSRPWWRRVRDGVPATIATTVAPDADPAETARSVP